MDWSDVDWENIPKFQDAEVNEVVLQTGDFLYLPTNWFHQCNNRSGVLTEYMDTIHQCGF